MAKVMEDLKCPICKETLSEPFATTCGHTFCHSCIQTHLQTRQKCPCCSAFLTTAHIHPIFALEKVIASASELVALRLSSPVGQLKSVLQATPLLRTCEDIDDLVATLKARRHGILKSQQETKLHLLLQFLEKAKEETLQRVEQVRSQLKCLDEDLALTEQRHETLRVADSFSAHAAADSDGSKRSARDVAERMAAVVGAKRQCVMSHFNDFKQSYIALCARSQADQSTTTSPPGSQGAKLPQKPSPPTVGWTPAKSRSTEFGHVLSVATQYTALEKEAEILPQPTATTSSGKVPTYSAINFSCNQKTFAVGGSAQRIKLYNHDTVLSDGVGCHTPLLEWSTQSRVGCISFSHAAEDDLVSCGSVNGTVTRWNAATGAEVRSYHGHSKRVWSVAYSSRQPGVFVSGSDDHTVRVWSGEQPHATMTIDLGYNVCCVDCSPVDGNVIAAGTAGHTLALYDLRHTKEPLAMTSGLQKAVSYVQFMGGKQVVSASTNSLLSLWDVPELTRVRTFSGHANKKNFVGLSVNGSYIACGSETSQVHVYCKELPRPILTQSVSSSTSADAASCFTLAVAWKPNSTHLLASTSTGSINILSMRNQPL